MELEPSKPITVVLVAMWPSKETRDVVQDMKVTWFNQMGADGWSWTRTSADKVARFGYTSISSQGPPRRVTPSL